MKVFKTVGTDCPHGIYVYDRNNDVWILVRCEGEPFVPDKDGVYVIYFDNTKCPACRKYDNIWFPFVQKYAKQNPDMHFVIVLCEWFARNCKSEAAAGTFRKYDVHASPTTIFLYVKNGKEVYNEKYEGVLYEFELKLITEGFVERAEKSLRGEKVEKPVKASTTEAIQQLIQEILRLIIEKEKSLEEKSGSG